MQKLFIIIGLTGPLNSGCSTVAEYLCKMQNNKDEFQKEHDRISTDIIRLSSQIDNTMEKLSKAIENGYKIREQFLFEKLTKLNREFRQCFENTYLYDVLLKSDFKNFTKVSFSDLIVFTIIRDIYEDSTNKTNKIRQLEELYGVHYNEEHVDEITCGLEAYKDVINNHSYTDVDKLNKIDSMFNIVKSIKYQFKNNLSVLQDMGDNLRRYGKVLCKDLSDDSSFQDLHIIAQEANKYVKYMRRRTDDKKSNYFVIDSFRNPYEVLYFKRYGSFYLVNMNANYDKRESRSDINSDNFDKADRRDSGEQNSSYELYKQNVVGCSLLADYSIENSKDDNSYQKEIHRLLALIEEPGCVQPTRDESFMNLAYGLSLRSTCVSRQVGAVITNEDGYIIGAGWNDVGAGQIGCSVHKFKNMDRINIFKHWHDEFNKFDNNCTASENYICFKDIKSKHLIKEKIDDVINKSENVAIKDLDSSVKTSIIHECVNKIKIKRLEYSRALHAEENALLQVAKHGGMGVKDGVIYTTTFPCELCTKKIYQSGIRRVVYTEPYPNSISKDVFFKDGIRQIILDQFVGVKSPSFHKLFKNAVDKKDLSKADIKI